MRSYIHPLLPHVVKVPLIKLYMELSATEEILE